MFSKILITQKLSASRSGLMEGAVQDPKIFTQIRMCILIFLYLIHQMAINLFGVFIFRFLNRLPHNS